MRSPCQLGKSPKRVCVAASRLSGCLALTLALLGGWAGRAAEDDPPKEQGVSAKQTPDQPRDAQRQEVEKFIRTYFRTWSNRDIEGYDACFLRTASIQFIDPRGKLKTYARAQFVADQRRHHRTARHRMTEVPESIDIRFESKLARAVVYWKLTAGPTTDFGYDHFTLIKQRGEWRIVNLVFYSVEPT